MKKTFSIVLFLSILLLVLSRKPNTLVSRINKVFRMFAVSELVNEYTPSKYAASLYDQNSEVTQLSVKVQMCRDCISSVLDLLGFDSTVIDKVASVKVSQLMDTMDLFVAIAKGVKSGSNLADMNKILSLTDDASMTTILGVAEKVTDATDFIKDTIHPSSVLNSRKEALEDELEEADNENEEETANEEEDEPKIHTKKDKKEQKKQPNRKENKNTESSSQGFREVKFERKDVPLRKVGEVIDENAAENDKDEFDDIIDDEMDEDIPMIDNKDEKTKHKAYRKKVAKTERTEESEKSEADTIKKKQKEKLK